MKMQKSVIFVKKNLKINIWKIKKYYKVRDHCHYTREYRGSAHSKFNLRYSVHKKIPIVFHNRSNLLLRIKLGKEILTFGNIEIYVTAIRLLLF